MLIFQVAIWAIFLISYIGLRILFGTKIFYDQADFFTVREVMFPLLAVLLHTQSWIITGYSWFFYALAPSCLLGLYLLSRKKATGQIQVLPFIHYFVSIVFLIFELSILILQIIRFIPTA